MESMLGDKKINMSTNKRNQEGLLRRLITVVFLLCSFLGAGFAEDVDILKVGMESDQVASIQEVLKSEGYYTGEIDGLFGGGTEQAVRAYQHAHQLVADGLVGKKTLSHMFELDAHGHDTETEETTRVADLANELVSRGQGNRTAVGAYLDWWKDVRNKLIFPDDELLIRDFETGQTFNVVAIAGSNHMDVEALTYEDAQTIKTLWGGDYSWARRPVIAYLNGQPVAASLNAMPHAGRDDKPYKEYVYNRSAGYGYGYNYDKVKGNDFEGVICLHFKGSLLHKNAVQDSKHQAAVRKAAGLQ